MVWSIYFADNALANGRRTKDADDLDANHGISWRYVMGALHRVAQFCGLPCANHTNQGLDFTCKALVQCVYQSGV